MAVSSGRLLASLMFANSSIEMSVYIVVALMLIARIGTGPRDGVGPDHPLFGPLTWREWGAATYKHVDHHLKQFGA